MKKGLLSFLFLVFAVSTGLSLQADSLQVYIISESTRAFDLAFQDPVAAALISKEMVAKAEANTNDLAAANAYNSLGWSYFHQGELDSSIHTLKRSKELFLKERRPKEVIQVSINLSEVHLRKSAYQAALRHLVEADSVNVTLGDAPLQTDLYRQFAILYRELGSYDKATSYFLRAMDGFLDQDDFFRYTNTGISLSILYRKKELWDESLSLLLTLDSSSVRYKLSPYQMAMVNENLGETYFGKQDFQSALGHFTKAFELFSFLSLGADMAYELMNIGKSHQQLGHGDDAERYLLQAYHLSDSLELTNYSHEIAMELSSLYASKKDWERAFSFSEEARILFDSLNIQEQVRFSRELAEKYENDKKEQEIALLTTRNALNESKRKKAIIWLYFLVAVTIASLLIAWLMRSRIRLNKKLEHERSQNRIAGDIEDERILNQFVVSLFEKYTATDILRTLVQRCVDLFEFDNGQVYTIHPEDHSPVFCAEANGSDLNQNGQISAPILEGAVGMVCASGKSVLQQSKEEMNNRKGHAPVRAGKSEMAAPLLVNGKVFAIVRAHRADTNPFSERQLRLLERAAAVSAERISRLINEDKLRHHIARDLHDEVGSTLTSIGILSKLATNEADPRQGEYLQKIHAYTGYMMDSMSDIIWAINPSHDSMPETLLRMKEYAIELIESAGMVCKFNVQGSTETNTLGSEERKYIYLIFREAVHNAVKYSQARNIAIRINQSEETFSFLVEDDGIGFDLDRTHFGNGIQNMYDRAKAIQASLEIKTAEGNGTSVFLAKKVLKD